MTAMTERVFLGVSQTDIPPVLVARFEVVQSGQCYYMTMQELCDWVEHQMASGMYYSARENMAVDREALLCLISAQRQILSGKKAIENFPAVTGQTVNFTDFVQKVSLPTSRASNP